MIGPHEKFLSSMLSGYREKRWAGVDAGIGIGTAIALSRTSDGYVIIGSSIAISFGKSWLGAISAGYNSGSIRIK